LSQGLLVIILASIILCQQNATSSDLQNSAEATQLLEKSYQVMGGPPPSDTVATGSVTVVAGTDTETGTAKILTKNSNESLEEISLSKGINRTIYSHGAAAVLVPGSDLQEATMERTASSQTSIYPLPLIAGIISSTDSMYKLIGTEDVQGLTCLHILTWNSFASYPKVQFLSEFTKRDIWVEVQTGLLRRLSYEIRDAGGAAPRLSMDIYYSDYRSIGVGLYPFAIKESMNGTPWMEITIQNAHANAGLTDSTFQIQ
jgi:hypothetical protein